MVCLCFLLVSLVDLVLYIVALSGNMLYYLNRSTASATMFACAGSENSDQPAHQRSLIRNLARYSVVSQ